MILGALRDPARTAGVGNPETTDLERRVADVVKTGRVTAVDYAGAVARVGIGDATDPEGYIETGWLPFKGRRAAGEESEWDPPEVGEVVEVHAEGGELQCGIIQPGALYTSGSPAAGNKAGLWRRRFKGGAVIEFDRDTGAMTLDATEAGSLTLRAGGVSIVLANGKITLTGPVEASDTVTAATDVVGGDVSLKGHTHSDPQGGNVGPAQ